MARFAVLLLCLLTLVLGMVACGSSDDQSATPESTEPDYAAAITEQLLESMESGDYAPMNEYFDEPMKAAMDKTDTEASSNDIQAAYGDYVSHEYSTVQYNVQEIYTVVLYDVVFSGKTVTLQVTFLETEDDVYLSGFYFR